MSGTTGEPFETGAERASPEVAGVALRKILTTGRLLRMPRHPEIRDILLAFLCLEMRRRYPYSEIEMNHYLQEALAVLRARVDHVTCRRYLVDLGFLKRDRAGTRYFLNYPRVESVLSDEAMSQAPDLVAGALAESRQHRSNRARGRDRS